MVEASSSTSTSGSSRVPDLRILLQLDRSPLARDGHIPGLWTASLLVDFAVLVYK